MPPKPQLKTYSIINGLAIAGPFSYLLSPVFFMFYLTLLNSYFSTHSLPATYIGAILLLVKPCFSVYGLYLTKYTTSAIGTTADVVVEIPLPGSTVVMSHNQGSTDLHGVFVNRRLFFGSFFCRQKKEQEGEGCNIAQWHISRVERCHLTTASRPPPTPASEGQFLIWKSRQNSPAAQ